MQRSGTSLLIVLSAVGTLSVVLPVMAAGAVGVDYYVSPSGSDEADGRSASDAKATIQAAIELAGPGDTVHLAPGTYGQDVRTARNGTADDPITVTGPPEAVVSGAGNVRIVEVNHDHHVFSGFTVDGRHGSDRVEGYRKKLIYAQGEQTRSGVTGLRVVGMTLTNALDECVRLRYFAEGNELSANTISNCGLEDFKFGGGGKNGEGIYIGTAPEQTDDGKNPTADPDASTGNIVRNNRISNVGECVDIKEAAHDNVVEANTCTGALDPNSGGIDSRGNDNVIRSNEVTGGDGAGVRLGGDTTADGVGNDVYGNTIADNRAGGIKFMAQPQGLVCGNVMSGNTGGDAVGTYRSQFDPTQTCPSNVPTTTTTSPASTTTTSPASTTTSRPSTTTTTPATTTTSALPTTTTPPSGGPRIEEHFGRSAGGMAVVSGGTWAVKNGSYRLARPDSSVDIGNSNLSVHRTVISGDFRLTATGRTEGTNNPFNDFSVVFGYVDATHYCFASFNEGNDDATSGIFRVDGSAVTEVADIDVGIRADRTYDVAVSRLGSVVTVQLDGVEVASASPDCGAGQVGFGSRNDAGRFDDLVVE